MYLSGDSIRFEDLTAQLKKKSDFASIAEKLIWDANGTRFYIENKGFYKIDGSEMGAFDGARLAHNIELDWDEIVSWQEFLDRRGIIQPFCQAGEAVVLENGDLKSETAQNSPDIKLLTRYLGLTVNAADLKSLGFKFISRPQYGGRKATISVITPAGAFIGCKPLEQTPIKNADKCVLELDELYLYENTGLRAKNHTFFALESLLIEQLILEDNLDMLLAHIAVSDSEGLKSMYARSVRNSRTRKAIRLVAERRGIALC